MLGCNPGSAGSAPSLQSTELTISDSQALQTIEICMQQALSLVFQNTFFQTGQ